MTAPETPSPKPHVKDLAAAGLHSALRVSPTSYWTEMRMVDQAMLVGRIGGTTFGEHFRGEFERAGAHAMPHRWFALIDENDGRPVARVSMCVPSGHAMDGGAYRRAYYVTGLANANPYPDFKHQIDEFGKVLGLRIPPNWMGRQIDHAAHAAPSAPHR